MFAGTTMFAQDQPPQNNNDGQQQTITGCLTKGDTNGQYAVTDKDGQKYTFNGPQRLDDYTNHTVQLSGTMNNQNGQKQFMPKSIKTVADTCQGGGQ
jgi:hypothetical protein